LILTDIVHILLFWTHSKQVKKERCVILQGDLPAEFMEYSGDPRFGNFSLANSFRLKYSTGKGRVIWISKSLVPKGLTPVNITVVNKETSPGLVLSMVAAFFRTKCIPQRKLNEELSTKWR
jgi:hypothetical protein